MGLAAPSPVHGYGNPVGKVCISETPNLCPETPAIFAGNPGDNLTVHVVVQGADSFIEFRVLVRADPSILDPLWVDVSGNVLDSRPAADLFALCIDGTPLTTNGGDCLPQDGPGVVDVGATGLYAPFPGATGLLFKIGYKIIGSTFSSPIDFPTGCPASSTPTGHCVSLLDTGIIGGSPIMPATVQAGSIENAQYMEGDFAISVAPASMSIARGMTAYANVSLSSFDGFAGTVSLTIELGSYLAAWLDPKVVTLSAGQTITVKLTISSLRTINPGPRNATVVGTIGPLSHSVDLSLTLVETQTISLVKNGGFDSRFAFWQPRGLKGASFQDPADPSRDRVLPDFKVTNSTGLCTRDEEQGTPFAQIEGALGSNGFLEQYIPVPPGGALLAFHTWGQYRQYNPAVETVTIVDGIENRFTLDRFAPPSTIDDAGLCTGTAPALKTYDLSDFSGQTIRLRLGGEGYGCCSALVLYDDIQVVPYGGAALPPERGTPDFAVTATPDNVVVVDATVLVEVYVVSLNNFVGEVSLQILGLSGLGTSLSSTIVSLQMNETRVVTLSLWRIGDARSLGGIEVRGYSESSWRNTSIYVNMALWIPDFTVRLSPSSLVLAPGTSMTTTIRLTSIRGFAGDVSLTAEVLEAPDNSPTLILTPEKVKLEYWQSAASTLKVSTVEQTPLGNYTILLTTTSGFYGSTHYVIIPLTIERNPPSPRLEHTLTHDQTTHPEETLPILNHFANTGPTRIRLTNVLIAADFGHASWSSTSGGGPIELDLGQVQTLTLILAVPSNASLGSHAITVTVDWQYFHPGSALLWNDSPQLVTHGSVRIGPHVTPADNQGNDLSGMLDTLFQSIARPAIIVVLMSLGVGISILAAVLLLMLRPKRKGLEGKPT